MADSRIHIMAEVISQELDGGNALQATRLLQEELNTMPPAEALALVRAIERQERQWVGADLNLEHIEKPGTDLTKVKISQNSYDQFGHPLSLSREVSVIQDPQPNYSFQREQPIHHSYNQNSNGHGPLGHLLHGLIRHKLREN